MKRDKTNLQGGTSGPVRRGRPAKSVILCLVLLPLLVAAAWYRHQQVGGLSEEAKAARCMANMHLIYRALQAYREDHGGHYPASLSHFVLPPGEIYVKKYGRREWPGLYPDYISDPSVFQCPDDRGKGFDAGQMIHRSYLYPLQVPAFLPRRVVEAKEKQLYDTIVGPQGGRMILVQCPHHRKLANPWWASLVLRADGTVEWLKDRPAALQQSQPVPGH